MNELKEKRRSAGMALQEVAVKAKTSPSTLVMVEKYDYCPKQELRQRIAAALSVREDELWPDLARSDRR